MAMHSNNDHGWVGLRVKDILQAYIDWNIEAALHRKEETAAALMIQRAWRGHAAQRQNKVSAGLEQAIRIIQRCYRGHLGRARFVNMKRERDKELRMTYFNRHAVAIQSRFRGYYVRKHVFEFSARQGFLQCASHAGNVVRQLLAYHYKLQCRSHEDAKISKMKEEMDKWLDSKHHLVGTKHIKGVFYSPTLEGGPNELEEILHTTQKKHGRQAQVQKAKKKIQASNRLYNFKTPYMMSAGPYQSNNDRYAEHQKIASYKNVSDKNFILQIGPTRPKWIPGELPFRLQEPYGYQKFLRKQEKLHYEEMHPKLVEHPWKVIFPSGQLFDNLSTPSRDLH